MDHTSDVSGAKAYPNSIGTSPVLDQFRSSNPLTDIRKFESGAVRNSDDGKPDYEGFINPLVVARYGEYMHKHRHLQDGTLRDSDNWQKGIPEDQLLKSAWRHFHDWWMYQRGYRTMELIEDSLCALIFNASAYLFKILQDRDYRKR